MRRGAIYRLVIALAVLPIASGCLATGAAKAVSGALSQQPEAPSVTVLAPVTFEGITFQQVPIGALPLTEDDPPDEADEPEESVPEQPVPEPDPQDPQWLHAEPAAPIDQPFDRDVIRDALGPVFRDLDDRIEDLADRLSSMEGS